MAKTLDGFKMAGRIKQADLYFTKFPKSKRKALFDFFAGWGGSVGVGGMAVKESTGPHDDNYEVIVRFDDVPREAFADLVKAIRAEFPKSIFDGWGEAI
jgi:hypothetical protein